MKGEKLYNNIVLPENFTESESDASHVPYLENPPEVIDVTVGRQLFVDDFLIESSTLEPEYHTAKKYAGNPVLSPETPWERTECPAACPKDGGVFYDEKEGIYKMWYEGGWLGNMCYATSADGIHWDRPALDVEPGTNMIFPRTDLSAAEKKEPYLRADSTSFWIDDEDPDPSRRYKMYLRNPGGSMRGYIAVSSDGVHWRDFEKTMEVEDRSTLFYNPFRKKWVYSIRRFRGVRMRDYYECDDIYEAAHLSEYPGTQWMRTDAYDRPNPYIGFAPQLYNVNAVGYESIMVGMFEIHLGPENTDCAKRGIPKITELIPMYSRDGYHFSRPSRRPVVHASMYEGAWDRGYVQSAGGILVIHGDELWIYYTGFAGDESWTLADVDSNERSGMYREGATGIAVLRRDGFVSMNGKGSLVTRKFTCGGKKSLYINAEGSVAVSVLDEDGALLAAAAGFCGDSTAHRLDFGDFDVASLNGRVFRLRFEVDGKLYSFGFADASGDFGGAHAAGIDSKSA